jgi:hypothetical protein
MWVRRTLYDQVWQEWVKSREEAAIFQRVNEHQQTTMDWLMVRLTQLEKERAALLFKLSGVVIETPVITREPTSPIPQNVPVDALPIFDDMGEEQNPDGSVKYA